MALSQQEIELVIVCKHRQPWSCATSPTSRVMKANVRYREDQQTYICGQEKHSPALSQSEEVLGFLDPINCPTCQDELLEYLDSDVMHPEPEEALEELCNQISRHRTDLQRMVAETPESSLASMYTYILCYEIINKVERLCMPDNKEWFFYWVGSWQQQPEPHPPLPHELEEVKGEDLHACLEADDEITCAICLEGFTTNKIDAVVDESAMEVARQEEDSTGIDANVVSNKIMKLSCEHVFHKPCIDGWLEDGSNDNCPLCRFQLPPRKRCCLGVGSG